MVETKSFRMALPTTRTGRVLAGVVAVWLVLVLIGLAAEALAALFPSLGESLGPFLSGF